MRLSLPSAHAASLREMWLSLSLPQRRTSSRPATAGLPSPDRPIWRLKQLGWQPPAGVSERPPLAVMPPALLPAELRRATRAAIHPTEAHVRVQIAPSPAPHRALALSAADRQQRRLSWAERLRCNALPAGSSVELALYGAREIAELLDSPAPTSELAKTA
jgi:hypothetical protein